MPEDPLSIEQVRRVARLARLALTDEQAARATNDLARVLGYIDRLRAMDLAGAEPLTHVGGEVNRLDADEPGPTLDPGVLRAMAPATYDEFLRVPRVLDDASQA